MSAYIRGLFRRLRRWWKLRQASQLEITRLKRACRFVPPGHYYSPFPSDEDIQRALSRAEAPYSPVLGIDLNVLRQIQLLSRIGTRVPAFSMSPLAEKRYYSNNGQFGPGKASITYGMLSEYAPRRIVEVGAGFSSALVLDALDDLGLADTCCTFIDPYPDRLLRLLRPADLEKHSVKTVPVQDVHLTSFETLRSGDFLLIDSSHVCKSGSDVNHILFEILPTLAKGVLVCFDDVHFPFEYPRSWLEEGRAWTEVFLLRAFLQYNSEYRLLLFADHLRKIDPDALYRFLPACRADPGGNLWIQRCD